MDTCESKMRIEHRDLLEKEGIEGFLREIGGDGYVRTLSVALAHFAFRNGPVESMHSNLDIGLTEERMKTLNKFMVNRLGLFFLLLGCEDKDSINSVLAFHKQCGGQWDDPDLVGELERCGIDPERISIMRRLLGKSEQGPQRGSGAKGGNAGSSLYGRSPYEALRPCPHCGSEVLHRDPRTRLAHYVDMGRLSNKTVARMAGVPVAVVGELQHYTEARPTAKRQEQAAAVAEALKIPAEILFSFDPCGSRVRCDDCGASAPWASWNVRAGCSQ